MSGKLNSTSFYCFKLSDHIYFIRKRILSSMVFQRKSGGKGSKSPFQGKNKKPFEHDSELGMDFEEGNVEDDQLMKKTPKDKQSLGTPKGKQASFQIPDKNTPAKKTPKFVAKTPNSGEKKLLTPGYKGTTIKEFQGMKAGLHRPKNGKVKDEDSSDDDDEEEDDDGDEDFDLDLGGDDENEDDDKDDDDENEGDDKDDDDDDENEGDGDDDEVEMLDKHKKVMETNKEEKVKTPKSEKVEAAKPGKNTQVVKSEAKSSPKKVPDQRERKLRSLYLGNLPLDIEQEEIKTLSSDILEVIFPKRKGPWEQRKETTRFALLEFISEEKAEANYKDLHEKTLRGEKLNIDFSGEKSIMSKIKKIHNTEKNKNLKMLFIQGFPSKITIDKVAEIFPKSYQIILTIDNCAFVAFRTFEEAAAGFEAGKKATVKGTQLSVQYGFSNRSFSANKRKEHFKKPFQKKMKFV